MAMSTPTIPKTMRAWTFSTSGDSLRVLSLSNSHPVPSNPTESNLLIRISHAGLTSAGTNLMRDVPSFLRKKAIPELDFSGRVELAGPSAPSNFTNGTRVFGTIPPGSHVLSGVGALGEYVLVASDYVQVIPAKINIEEAAALGGLAQTAVRMLEKAAVAEGHRVLIHGASGGIGIVATQLAKAAGATVVATCSRRNSQMVKDAGGDEIIDYAANTPLYHFLNTTYRDHPFDIILDTVGSQELYIHCPGYLKPNGIYVNVGTMEDKGGTPRRFSMFGAAISKNGVTKLAEAAGKGELKVYIDSTFKMDDVPAAYERFRAGS